VLRVSTYNQQHAFDVAQVASVICVARHIHICDTTRAHDTHNTPLGPPHVYVFVRARERLFARSRPHSMCTGTIVLEYIRANTHERIASVNIFTSHARTRRQHTAYHCTGRWTER